jgi:GAF domain-containing protein
VCGSAWKEKRTFVVDNVEEFPGHIACSALSKSEIVIPVFHTNGEVAAVLDIDSEFLAAFDDYDQEGLEKICSLISKLIYA